MKYIRLVVPLFLVLFVSACGFEGLMQGLDPTEESVFAEDYVQRLRNRDYEFIKNYMTEEILAQGTDEKLDEIAGSFPEGRLLASELIGRHTYNDSEMWVGTFSFEYEFEGGWAIANVAVKRVEGEITVAGFNVERGPASLRELNAFTLSNKSSGHYVVLLVAALVPIFVIVTLVICIRTSIPRHKKRWVFAIVMCAGELSFIWTTGDYSVQPISISLFGSGAVTGGPHAPWVITTSIPIGAIVFWAKRRTWTVMANKDESIQSVTDKPAD